MRIPLDSIPSAAIQGFGARNSPHFRNPAGEDPFRHRREEVLREVRALPDPQVQRPLAVCLPCRHGQALFHSPSRLPGTERRTWGTRNRASGSPGASSRFRNAAARWEIRFFTSPPSSAKLRSYPSGMNSGS